MLVHLHVRDLVLIEALDLPLAAGFNVLTGETGAGKSLVATAVGLLLGRKISGDVVRRGAKEAEVEGLFDISDEPRIKAALEAAGLPVSDELLIRRILPAEGRQRAFVNGRLASLALLVDLARDLASFAGQHEHLALLDAARQLELVDAFGKLEPEVARMTELAGEAAAALGRLTALREKERDRAQRLDYLAFQLKEIDELAPQPDEIDTLATEAERLRHLTDLLGAARRAVDDLYETDGSVYERLSAHAREIEHAAEHDPELQPEAENLLAAATEVEEAARRLGAYGEGLAPDPDRLDEVIERLELLKSLERKHGLDLAGVLLRRDEIEAEVGDLSRYEEALSEATGARDRAATLALEHAGRLTAARKKAGTALAKDIRRELEALKLAGADFRVERFPSGDEPGPTGLDRVEFVVSLNPGEGIHPLREVASGGELSRMMLAIRRALAGVGPVGTYVFDEVDAGVGGAEAALVGKMLGEVARHHQVICITHLPQIAGLSTAHFRVVKARENDRTVTSVAPLDPNERIEELARMLSGECPTDRARAAAVDLMSSS
jgi:DNA repair protein RecN (Recombination protein N)